MICRLCLNDVENCFDFFSTKGIFLNAAKIISQHFWFEPREDDTFSKNICGNCWGCVSNFHTFYVLIEDAHKLLTTIKSDPFEEKPEIILDNNNDHDFSDNKYNKLDNSVDSYFHDTKFENIFEESANIQSPIIQTASNDDSSNDTEIKKLRRPRRKNLPSLLEDQKNEDTNLINKQKKKNSNRKKKIKCQKNIFNDKIDEIMPVDVKRKYEFFSDEQITKIKTLNCSSCSEKITSFSELKKHMIEVHGESGYAVCCEKKFYKRYKFVNHLQAHLNPDEFKCPHCDKRLASKRNMKLHIKNMHTEIGKMKKFNCDQCDKTFAQKAYLDRHRYGHIPESEKHFACDKCGNRFPTPALLRVHTINVHESRHSAICDLCGKKYKSPADLKRHRLEHMGIHEPKVQCEICGDWLSNKYKLKRHMLKHTTADVEHRCNVCNKISGNLLALKSHMRLHIATRKFQCNICEKGFRRSLNLKEHMTTHTGETLYTCPNCSRTFTHHSNLHHHRKKMHPKELEEDRKLRYLKIENYNKTLGTRKLDLAETESNTDVPDSIRTDVETS